LQLAGNIVRFIVIEAIPTFLFCIGCLLFSEHALMPAFLHFLLAAAATTVIAGVIVRRAGINPDPASIKFVGAQAFANKLVRRQE